MYQQRDRKIFLGTVRSGQALEHLLCFLPPVGRTKTRKAIGVFENKDQVKTCQNYGHWNVGEFVEQPKGEIIAEWHEKELAFGFYAPRFTVCGKPAETKIVYETIYDTRFSLYFCVDCLQTELMKTVDFPELRDLRSSNQASPIVTKA